MNVKLLLVIVLMLNSWSVEGELDSCPTWTYNNTECLCGAEPQETVSCDEDSLNVKVMKCYCMTFSSIYNKTVMGNCKYNCYLNGEAEIYYSIPQQVQDLNNKTCGIYNRKDQMCSKCKDRNKPSVYSYDYYCTECTDYKYNWVKYILIAYLPVTITFVVMLCFKMNITKSFLYAYVLVGQLSTTTTVANLVDTQKLHIIDPTSRKHHTDFLKLHFTVLGIWNLDFGRSLYEPFCLHPSLSTHHVIALDYLIAVYPLLLILLTYILVKLHDNYRLVVLICKPFYCCIRRIQKEWNIKASLIDVFATFILLSNVKLLNVSFDLISVPVTLWDKHYTIIPATYTYTNGSMEYLGKEHWPYFALGVIVIMVSNVLPILLFCFYPFRWFQRCLNCCSLSSPSIHIFMDAFQGCYKTTPRDYRHMAVLPLILILLNFLGFSITRNYFYFTLMGCLLTALSFTTISCRPFRINTHNYLHGSIYLLASVSAFTQNKLVYFRKETNFSPDYILRTVMVLYRGMVFLPTILILVYMMVKLVQRVKLIIQGKLQTRSTYRLKESDSLLHFCRNT